MAHTVGKELIELYGGKHVWPSELSTAQIMQKVCGTFEVPPVPPSVEHIDPPQQDIFRACVNISPLERPDAQELLHLLESM